MEGKRPAAGDVFDSSQGSGKRRKAGPAPDDQDGGGDGYVTGAREEAPPPQAEQPGHQILGGGGGGGGEDALGVNIRFPLPVDNPIEASSSSQPVQQPGPGAMVLPSSYRQHSSCGTSRFYMILEEDIHRGWNSLVDVTVDNARLLRELKDSEKELASLRQELVTANRKAMVWEAALGLAMLKSMAGLNPNFWPAARDAGARGICLLCGARPATVALLPCQHCCICSSCSTGRQTCPSCLAMTAN